ncbi:dienelactone hydrolase family protein [Polyangium spumosum]|uniref:Dienelactone hydrolase family protein n=1 Tax=Polyangium spumosum TaxID=889282 RepID=A0A6N7Q1I0_9BACT|nr:dienelactone hydrolase family protein [Polyangium spumosum]MRG97046.1 dienelactone hydrolase family protein [Polyangium spumosum]
MNIRTERVQIPVGDGTTMSGYLCRPEGDEPRPAILVLQEIFGVNAHIRDVAERFAREGYVTLAPDLFHRISPGYEGGYEDFSPSLQLAGQYKGEQSEADVRAAADYLDKHPAVADGRVAALGFCMGGRLSFVANGVAKLRCAVSFYGNIAPDKLAYAETQSGPVLLIWAGKDPYISLESTRSTVDALRKHEKPYVSIEFSQYDHGFFCDARSNYDAVAAAQAWALTLAFLKSHL